MVGTRARWDLYMLVTFTIFFLCISGIGLWASITHRRTWLLAYASVLIIYLILYIASVLATANRVTAYFIIDLVILCAQIILVVLQVVLRPKWIPSSDHHDDIVDFQEHSIEETRVQRPCRPPRPPRPPVSPLYTIHMPEYPNSTHTHPPPVSPRNYRRHSCGTRNQAYVH